MRKFVVTAALGFLAMATAAVAQLVEAKSVKCAHLGTDRANHVELARFVLPGRSGRALA